MKRHTRRTIITSLVLLLVLVGALFTASILLWDRIEPIVTGFQKQAEESEEPGTEAQKKEPETEVPVTEAVTETEAEEHEASPEDAIYTFLQGPKSWKTKVRWSGSWCNLELEGDLFGAFGCGLCDLANIYSTLTEYECSPVDMYYFAKEVTDYAPGWGYSAIDWPYLKETLRLTGFTSKLRKKDKTYANFQKRISKCETAIVLVSSYDDDTYWQDTPGHYVNIWLYDENTDLVFLADSGDPDHNRTWVPLRYIYDALASTSPYQYLTVTDYDPEKNTWKHNGITERWRKPSYYHSKS